MESYHAAFSIPVSKICVPKQALGYKNWNFKGQRLTWGVIIWEHFHLPCPIDLHYHLRGDQPAIAIYCTKWQGKGDFNDDLVFIYLFFEQYM